MDTATTAVAVSSSGGWSWWWLVAFVVLFAIVFGVRGWRNRAAPNASGGTARGGVGSSAPRSGGPGRHDPQ